MDREAHPEPLEGPLGKAWDLWPPPGGEESSLLSTWLVHSPSVHPFWSDYLLIGYHLRVDGTQRPFLISPGASHEVSLWALDPEFIPADEASYLDAMGSMLKPANLTLQLELGGAEGDARCVKLCMDFARQLVERVPADTDYRRLQLEWWAQRPVPVVHQYLERQRGDALH